MEKYAINKNLLRQLSLMKNHSGPSTEILDSLYAQMVLEVSIYQFQKAKFIKDIDHALDSGDEVKFELLSQQYNEVLEKYKDGISCSEQGYEFTLQLES